MSLVLVQKVRYFLGKVAQDRMFAEPHLICVEHFLPAQSTPANVAVSTTTEMEMVTKTEERRIAVLQDGAKRGHATRTKRKQKAAARQARCSGE